MSSESEDDCAEYGNPLEAFEDDGPPRKKPFSLMEQVVKDRHGRRRFHGAFTGGFTAGFLNSVGSLEGWTPTTFKSSRSDKAEKSIQKPEDFMDEEDMDEFGIAPKVLRASRDYNDSNKKRGRGNYDGSIPGEPLLRQLLQPARETVGMKLLKRMGWKPGQGTGPRVSKLEKKRIKEENKNSGTKMYGCLLPQNMGNSNADSSSDDENYDNLTFAPDDFQQFLCEPKVNCFGLGYSGLDKRPILSTHINLFEPTPLKIEEKKKKVLISGQAFGVGAFEEDDEDIYSREDMSQYDFTLETLSSQQKKEVASCVNYAGGAILGFILAKNVTVQKKHFPPPLLPQGFQPAHMSRNSASLQRHIVKGRDRPRIFEEPVARKGSINRAVQEENKRLSAEAMKITETLPMLTEEGCKRFRPFSAFPEKQQRYEKFLTLAKVGQKERLSYFQPLTMTDWEKEQEQVEFEQAARLYQPLSGVMSDRFVTASEPEDLNSPLSSVSKTDRKNEPQATREETDWRPCSLLCKRFNIPELYPGYFQLPMTSYKKEQEQVEFEPAGHSYQPFSSGVMSDRFMYTSEPEDLNSRMLSVSKADGKKSEQQATREETDWRPCSLLCKRFNIPELYPGSGNSCNIQEKMSRTSVFNFLDCVEHSLPESSASTSKANDVPLEFPDPPAKIDLYRAVFLSSSSEDSESGGEEQQSADTSQEEPVNVQRNTSPPRGIFANLDLDAINNRTKVKSRETIENKIQENREKSEDRVAKEVSSSASTSNEEMIYGPRLPSGEVIPATNVTCPVALLHAEWVEKTKNISQKEKNKKHKKSSKHKKHKSKHNKKKR